MSQLTQLLPIAGVLFLGVASPGPSFALITSVAMGVSRRAGVLTGIGFAAASSTWSLLAIAGLGLVLAKAPWIYVAMKIAGAGCLIWIGIKMLRDARKPMVVAASANTSGFAAFRKAYLVSITNPKTIAFYGSIFTLMVPNAAPAWFYAAVVLVSAAVSALWYCGVALLFSHKRVRGAFARAKAIIDAAVGMFLIAMGGRLLLSR